MEFAFPVRLTPTLEAVAAPQNAATRLARAGLLLPPNRRAPFFLISCRIHRHAENGGMIE